MQVLAHLPIVGQDGDSFIFSEYDVFGHVTGHVDDLGVFCTATCLFQVLCIKGLWHQIQRFGHVDHRFLFTSLDKGAGGA